LEPRRRLADANFVKLDLSQSARVKAYAERIAARPDVHEALKEEGLEK
jgi:hypothetical protein